MRLLLPDAPAATGAVVRAVAVLGDSASLAEAAHLARVEEAEAAQAGGLLVAREILTPGRTLELPTPPSGRQVYADIGSRKRVIAHTHAADLLAARGASEERITAQLTAAAASRRLQRHKVTWPRTRAAPTGPIPH